MIKPYNNIYLFGKQRKNSTTIPKSTEKIPMLEVFVDCINKINYNFNIKLVWEVKSNEGVFF